MRRPRMPAVLLFLPALALLAAGCTLLDHGDGSDDIARASTAFASAFLLTFAQEPATEPGTGTYSRTYTSPTGGTAKLAFTRAAGSAPGGEANARGGVISFSGYRDASTASVIDGSLTCSYYNTPSSAPGTAYTSYNSFMGTLTFSGGFKSQLTFDCLVTVYVPASGSATQSLAGKVSVNGTWYDVATGTRATVTQPTVTFNPPTSVDAAGNPMSVTMNCPGADVVYYTTDGSLPTSKSTAAASGTTLTAIPAGSVIMAYSVTAGASSRISLFVYPAY